MFSEKNIIVTIGNYGSVVALHEGKEIKHKVFLDALDENSEKQIKEIFLKNKSASVYILLDTVEQSYKKKTYPAVRKMDLMRILKRDLANDGDRESIKNYLLLSEKKDTLKHQTKRWEALFISTPNSELLNRWVSFLLEMPNHLHGIYMLPIEAFNLFSLLKNSIKSRSRTKNKHNEICCLILQNKVSGIRQIVFSEQGIVFTRVVNYNLEQGDFLEKYEHDIYSTFEYLKRIFPDLFISEFDIINILPEEYLQQIAKINNVELNFINYTPNKVALEIGYGKALPENSHFCDLLISKIFSKKNKILKFTTPKIKFFEKFFIALKTSYYLNLFLVMAICSMILFAIFSQNQISESVDISEVNKLSAIQNLNKLKKATLDSDQAAEQTDSTSSINRIVDMGKIDEILSKAGADFSEIYGNLKFLKDFNVQLDRFSYNIQNFNSKFPAPNLPYEIKFGGKIFNKSGDIEDLFKEFDSLVLEVKKDMPNNQVKYSELPRNIDFGKKYYEFPIDFTLSNKTK